MSESAESYERRKQRAATRGASESRKGRDIGPIPAVVDPERKAKARESFEFFCRTYFPETFYLPWSNDHRKAIDRIETVVHSGGLYAYAMPRGSGKTTLAEAGATWAVLYGLRQFPLMIGSDQSSADELLASIKGRLERNDLLMEDFPEVCHPIRKLEGLANRCTGQHTGGSRTYIHWSADVVVLPTVKGSPASACIIAAAGITGRIRGMRFTRPDGVTVRPDLVILDDPQTDDSARSPSQCKTRKRIINNAVLGLAGPGKKIAAMMPCTVISPEDVADELLDRKKHPEWQGERTKLMYAMPKRDDLWQQYAKLRSDSLRAGNEGKEATEFYRANRETMDEGAIPAWSARHNADEISAVQHAMNLQLRDPNAFAAEYQNEPIVEKQEGEEEPVDTEALLSKLTGLDRGVIPQEATHLVIFIDVQKPLLPWMALAVNDGFGGAIVDYGTFPDQKRERWTKRDAKRTLAKELKVNGDNEAAVHAGLEVLVNQLMSREWKRQDGASMKPERIVIDANWGESTDVIYQFCRQNAHAAVLMPSHGRYVGATSRPFNQYQVKPGDRIGLNWRIPTVQNKRSVRYLLFNTNFWKTFAAARLRTPAGGKGAIGIFGRDRQEHELLTDHLKAEKPVRVEAKGNSVVEWKIDPIRPDNDWWDCLVGCCVASSEKGAALEELREPARAARKRVKLSEMQKKAKHWKAA